MAANHALDELLRVSDDVRAAVVFELGGELEASNLPDEEARELAAVGDAMLAYAAALREDTEVRQLRAVTSDGDVYVLRQGERAVVAIASAGSTPGLVQHDLRMLLSDRSPRKRKAVATT